MAKTGSNNVLGLYVGPNQLEGPQDGAYSLLQNCVIKDKGVIEPRQGVSEVLNNLGAHDARVTTLAATAALSTGAIQHVSVTNSIGYSSTSLATGLSPPEDWCKMRFADAMGHCYATTATGVRRIESDGSVSPAGGPVCYMGGGQLATALYNASGFMPLDSSVLYRAVIVRKDALKREIIGPASGRCVVRCQPTRTAPAGSVVRNTNVVTVTTGTTSHGFRYGETVLATFDAADTGANEFDNGTKVITSVPAYNQFTYDETDSNYTSTADATYALGPALGLLIIYLDSTVAAGDFIRLFRSETVTSATAVPPEDVYQVYERILTATDISTGYVTIQDNTPEVLLGDPSYFSPSVEGEAGSNERPPRAVDVCASGGSLVYGNLRYPHALELRLLATGGADGIVDATTITITDGTSPFTITAETGAVGAGEFGVYISSSPAQDAEKTAQAIVDAINVYASNTIVRAYYVSSADEAPGMIRLVKRDFSTTGFTVVSTRGAAWATQILNTGTATASRQENAVSSVAISKPGLPNAVPLLSRFDVGEPNENILRVLAIRDNKAIILKERSVWLMSGVWPNIRLDSVAMPMDIAFAFPDTAQVVDGTVYALSSVGVVGITESGVQLVGGPVAALLDFTETTRLQRLSGLSVTAIDGPRCWAAADPTLGCYLLFYSTEGDTVSGGLPPTSACLAFSPAARSWSGPWDVDWTAYCRTAFGALVVGLPDVQHIATGNTIGADKRGTYTHTVATQPTATTLTFADTSVMEVGGLLNFTMTVGPSTTIRRWVISAISGATVTLNVSHGSIFTEGASQVTYYRPFECIAEPVPLHAGGNGNDAQVHGVSLLMDKESFASADISVAGGDIGQEYLSAKTLDRWGWGEGTWGGADNDEPWGGYDGIRPERAAVPADSQRAPFHQVRLTVREAGAKWRLHGVQLELEPGTIKGRR